MRKTYKILMPKFHIKSRQYRITRNPETVNLTHHYYTVFMVLTKVADKEIV